MLFDNGCIAFDSACKLLKEKLNVIQANALRICCHNGVNLGVASKLRGSPVTVM